jgi:hypothetical protein
MLSQFIPFTLLLFISSCALFKTQNIKTKNTEQVLSFLKGEGEGKGRLGLGQHQYLFSFDAILKQNTDWILAVSIPLHGEEILVLSDLKSQTELIESDQSFELRIEKGMNDLLQSEKRSPQLVKNFMREFRNLMRFVFHQKLNQNISCVEQNCSMGDSLYRVEFNHKLISVKKMIDSDYQIELVATNLTDSIFKRTNIFLHSKKSDSKATPILSLELFWN